MIIVDGNNHASEKERHEHHVDCLMALKWVSCSIMATGDVPSKDHGAGQDFSMDRGALYAARGFIERSSRCRKLAVMYRTDMNR